MRRSYQFDSYLKQRVSCIWIEDGERHEQENTLELIVEDEKDYFSFSGMADQEQVMGIFPCIVKRQVTQLFVTTDRLILHTAGTSVDDADVILLVDITGHILNKPKPGVPQEQQKALVKIFIRGEGRPQGELVIDFTGDDRFGNLSQCDLLLRQNAGDKAEERRIQLAKEQERQRQLRQKFLADNPDIMNRYQFLTSEGGLSQQEFWEQYEDALALVSLAEEENESSSVPIPLRRPDILHADITLNISDRKDLEVSKERAEEIFSQFPKAKELHDELVPTAISEKNFWRRFFHSQYFNLSQGVQVSSTSKQDPYFDGLLADSSKTQINRPGSMFVDPEIDLTTDYLLSDQSVFSFRDSANDASQKPEIGGKLPPAQAIAHGTLVNRFNKAGARLAVKEPTDDADILSSRRQLSENVDLTDPIKADLTAANPDETAAVTKADIERLRRKRATRTLTHPPYQNLKILSEPNGAPGIDTTGSAEALIQLTQELVAPMSLGDGSSKKARRLDASDEATEVNENIERALELLKYFFATKLYEQEKRDKVLQSLDALRSKFSSMSSKLKFLTEWTPSIHAVESMISRAEDVNAALSVTSVKAKADQQNTDRIR